MVPAVRPSGRVPVVLAAVTKSQTAPDGVPRRGMGRVSCSRSRLRLRRLPLRRQLKLAANVRICIYTNCIYTCRCERKSCWACFGVLQGPACMAWRCCSCVVCMLYGARWGHDRAPPALIDDDESVACALRLKRENVMGSFVETFSLYIYMEVTIRVDSATCERATSVGTHLCLFVLFAT